jgi:hypothetical protein
MIGAPRKHDYIDMGGMFTILKVRDNLTSYEDPGWYKNPPGTLASLASNEELQRDLGFAPTPQDMQKPMNKTHMDQWTASFAFRRSRSLHTGPTNYNDGGSTHGDIRTRF